MKFINDKKLPMLQRLSKKLGKKLTFIDIETNDLVQNDDFAVIQLALIQISEDAVEERVTYVDPGIPIKEFASKLTGINSETIETAPKFDKFVKFISKVAMNDILMGFNTKTFVAHGLVKECKKHGVDVTFNQQIDIKPLLLARINEDKNPKETNISLEEAKKLYHITLDEGKPHQADFDLAGTVLLAEEMLVDYGLKYFEKDYLRFLNKNNPEFDTKKEKTYYNRELPNVNELKPLILDFIINSEKRLSEEDVAKHFNQDAYKISFMLTDLINDNQEVRDRLKNPETIGWLSETLPKAIKEVWSDEVSNGKLKPLFSHLNKIKPRDIDLNYSQLRIAIAELKEPTSEKSANKEINKNNTEKKHVILASENKEEGNASVDKNINANNNRNTSKTDSKKVDVADDDAINFPEQNNLSASTSSSDDMIDLDEINRQASMAFTNENDSFFEDDFTHQFEQDFPEKVNQSNKIDSSNINDRTSIDMDKTHENDKNTSSHNDLIPTPHDNPKTSRFSRRFTTKTTEVKEEKVTPPSSQSSNNEDFTFTVNETDIEKELTKPKKRFSIRR